MGRHADAGRSRGVARWVITAAVVVLVVVAVTVGYFVVVDRSDSAADGACRGSVTLPVAAGTDAAPAVTKAVAAFNATKPVARSTCVTASVTSVPDATALAGLLGRWPAGSGTAPGLWIPDNAAALAALDASRPDLAAGHPTDPMAWSPVVLAVRSGDVPAVASLAWADLPAAAGPDGSAALPDARHLMLALPPITSNQATSYALQSMLAPASGKAALTARDVTDAAAALHRVGNGAAGPRTTAGKALSEVAAGTGSATAVPVVEATLVAFDLAGGDTGAELSAVHPKGPTAGDSLIAAPITAGWVDQTTAAAASALQAYLSDSAGQQILADQGWRTASAHPARPVPGVDVSASVTVLPAASPEVDAALASRLGQPAPPVPSSTAPPTGSTSSGSTSGGTASGTAPSTATGSSTSTNGSVTTTSPTTTSKTASSKTASSTPTTSASTSANPAAKGPVLTVLVDSSSPMSSDQDGKSLLAWVQRGLPAVLDGTVTDRAGLWAFADSGTLPPDGYPQLVSTGPLSGKAGSHLRSTALKGAIADLKAGGDRWAYGALIAALKKVPDAAVAGRASRVLLITSGVDQTPTTPRQMVLDAEAKVKGKVRVDVIGIGNAVPVDAYQTIAKAGGGKYIPVTDPSKLGQTITDLLTLAG